MLYAPKPHTRRPVLSPHATLFSRTVLEGESALCEPPLSVSRFLAVLLLPSSAFAQATLTGTVRDTSGGVLPGVTVEASSPALIEKIKTAVTDGSGQYRIVDLRAGHLHADVHAARFQHRAARETSSWRAHRS